MPNNCASYKRSKRPGMTAIIINRDRVLLLKRRRVPIILNPGIWGFLSGGRDKNEAYINTAYREIMEETGIDKDKLTLLSSMYGIDCFDRRRRIKWQNAIFFFRSSTSRVKLDIENRSYRWAPVRDIKEHRMYTNVFCNEAKVLNKLEELRR